MRARTPKHCRSGAGSSLDGWSRGPHRFQVHWMARLLALCRVFDAVLTMGAVTLTLERGKQRLWMPKWLAQGHKSESDSRAVWHQRPSSLIDVMVPPQRELVKGEGPFPCLEVLLHCLPSPEPFFHCAWMFELNRKGECWELVLSLELNLSQLPA